MSIKTTHTIVNGDCRRMSELANKYGDNKKILEVMYNE